MIQVKDFVASLLSFNLGPFLMVPCSIFKPLNAWMMENGQEVIIPPNEAHAMGFASGSFLASGRPAVIFMQNSGLGNITNAQTSLNAIYKIPVLLVVSWRGEPGKKDAPEHEIMGKITKVFLNTVGIPFVVLSLDWENQLKKIVRLSQKEKRPVAVIVRDGFFVKENYSTQDLTQKYPLSRIEAIRIVKELLEKKAVFISTNGFTSRDSFAVLPTADFYMMGSMGHAFSLGVGCAWQIKNDSSDLRTVIFDGDGGSLMHLGSLAFLALKDIKKSNLIYILLDNEAHESTGSQPTFSSKIDFLKIAEGVGFPQRFSVTDSTQLKNTLKRLRPNSASFILIKINRVKTEETPRVSDKYTCEEIKERFTKNIFSKRN